MVSYRTYAILIMVPYLLLIITFHGYLQTYDNVPPQSAVPSISQREHYDFSRANSIKENRVPKQTNLRLVQHHLGPKLDLPDRAGSSDPVARVNQPNGIIEHNRESLADRVNQIKGVNTGDETEGKRSHTHQDSTQNGEKKSDKPDTFMEDEILANDRDSVPSARYRFRDLRLKGSWSYPSSHNKPPRILYEQLGMERVKGNLPHPFTTAEIRGAEGRGKHKAFTINKNSRQGHLKQRNDTVNILKFDKGLLLEPIIVSDVKDSASFNQIRDGHAGNRHKKSTAVKGKSIKPSSLLEGSLSNKNFITNGESRRGRSTGLKGDTLMATHWHSNFPLQSHCVRTASSPLLQPQPPAWNFSDHLQFQSVQGDYVYSAYLDERQEGQPKIRIIALLKRGFTKQFFCHFINHAHTTEDDRKRSKVKQVFRSFYETTKVQYYEMCENHANEYGGYILTCGLPLNMGRNSRPCSVTISVKSQLDTRILQGDRDENRTVILPIFTTNTHPMTPAGNFPHHSKRSNVFHPNTNSSTSTLKSNMYLSDNTSSSDDVHLIKQDFGVCVPPIFSYIPSTTLIEFIELTKILGADHITFYLDEVSMEIKRVLEFYRRQGDITVIPWHLPLRDKDVWYHGQLLSINDCLYRSIHRFKYVTFNDLDEFIVPVKHSNWSEMVRDLESLGVPLSGYSFQSAFFDPLSSGTRVLYDLESDLRTKGFSAVRTKIMAMPERIYELGIHHISRPIDASLQTHHVTTDLAYIHHYRQCVNDFDPKMKCQIYKRDETLFKYVPGLRHNVHRTMWLLKENTTSSSAGGRAGDRKYIVRNIL